VSWKHYPKKKNEVIPMNLHQSTKYKLGMEECVWKNNLHGIEKDRASLKMSETQALAERCCCSKRGK